VTLRDDEDAIETGERGELPGLADGRLRDAPVEVAALERRVRRPDRELFGHAATVLPRELAHIRRGQVNELAHAVPGTRSSSRLSSDPRARIQARFARREIGAR